ncbi:MAG: metal-dependent hydrolase [Planctomycetota bacterium]
MPSPIAHSVTGFVIFRLFSRDKQVTLWGKNGLSMSFVAIFLSNAPDLDFIPQLLTGEKYHHGLTHSITLTVLFAVVVGSIGCLFRKQIFKRLFFLTLIVYGSHLLLDFFTEGGKGIQLLWPFSESFFISPVSVFPGTHHSKGIFDLSHLLFIIFESFYAVFLLAGLWIWKKRNHS